MSGSREKGVFPRKLFRIQSQFFLLTTHALHLTGIHAFVTCQFRILRSNFSWSPRHSKLFAVKSVPVPGSFAVQFGDHLHFGDHLRACTVAKRRERKTSGYFKVPLKRNFRTLFYYPNL